LEPGKEEWVRGFTCPDEIWDLSRNRLLVFAYYYPQFYPFPENDAVFGENFTEWTMLAASPSHNKHGHEIRKPTTLGYYDLRDVSVRVEQGRLAKQYGVDGFFVYHYWLENRLVMGDVVEKLIQEGQPNRCVHCLR
jgi:lipopolysaccharide biosynthesis protein